MATDSTAGSPVQTPSGPTLPGMFARYKCWIEQELGASVPETGGADVQLLLNYHLGRSDQHGTPDATGSSQGKALRPTLCLFACEALASACDRAVPAAAALELIHNFSLLHDDIQDQDLERRHQPTAWSLWGVPRALVAGNAMHSTGDLAALRSQGRDVAPEVVLRVSGILTDSYLSMIEGQCLDLQFESRTDITTDEYLHMIACKTGALIRCGLETGALLAGGDESAVRAFAVFGDGLGRAFQIGTITWASGATRRRWERQRATTFAAERSHIPSCMHWRGRGERHWRTCSASTARKSWRKTTYRGCWPSLTRWGPGRTRRRSPRLQRTAPWTRCRPFLCRNGRGWRPRNWWISWLEGNTSGPLVSKRL